jgi:mannose-6-phosphate isomerase-like protein (cupin superfamily)
VIDGMPDVLAGRYEDEFVKRDRRWLPSRRILKRFDSNKMTAGRRVGACPSSFLRTDEEETMSVDRTKGWPAEWTESQSPAVGYSYVAGDSTQWSDGPWEGSQQLDLELTEASGGSLGSRRLRLSADFDSGSEVSPYEFNFIYVRAGEIDLESDGSTLSLADDDAVQLPLGTSYALRSAAGAELIQINVPAVAEGVVGQEGSPVVLRESDDVWKVGAGPRRFFSYRDLETSEPSEGRIHLHAVRAAEPQPGGTGWHYHSMAQIFVILAGEGVISVEGQGTISLKPGDAMCVGSGPSMRHNVSWFNPAYRLIELCAPAEYDTMAADPPPGFDA